MNDKEENKSELEGVGGMFYGIGWVEVLLILAYIFAPLVIRILWQLLLQ